MTSAELSLRATRIARHSRVRKSTGLVATMTRTAPAEPITTRPSVRR